MKSALILIWQKMQILCSAILATTLTVSLGSRQLDHYPPPQRIDFQPLERSLDSLQREIAVLSFRDDLQQVAAKNLLRNLQKVDFATRATPPDFKLEIDSNLNPILIKLPKRL